MRFTWRPVGDTGRGAFPAQAALAANAQAASFHDLTNVWQSLLWSKWDAEYPHPHTTCCDDFAIRYCHSLLDITLAGFHLESTVTSHDRWVSYVPTGARRRPEFGDICWSKPNHLSVQTDFTNDGRRCSAAAGQGGPGLGFDILGRVCGDSPYDWRDMYGWIDIRAFAGLPPMATRTAYWVARRRNWMVFYPHAFPMYYRFLPDGLVLRLLGAPPDAMSPLPGEPAKVDEARCAAEADNLEVGRYCVAGDGSTTAIRWGDTADIDFFALYPPVVDGDFPAIGTTNNRNGDTQLMVIGAIDAVYSASSLAAYTDLANVYPPRPPSALPTAALGRVWPQAP
jgi:hypothetical protein